VIGIPTATHMEASTKSGEFQFDPKATVARDCNSEIKASDAPLIDNLDIALRKWRADYSLLSVQRTYQ